MPPPSPQSLQKSFQLPVIDRAHPDYDRARSVWNAMIDKRPLFIVQPVDTEEVRRAVLLAREHELPLSVRAGGHGVAGFAVCNDGLVIDLSQMAEATADPVSRTAAVGGGAVLRALDAAGHAHGLATTAGVYKGTGVAGLALGGGVGLLMRQFGLTCDNLIGAQVVTADGEIVETSETIEPELLWGLRGGGGNFGVVTQMQFQLHPLTDIYGGELRFALSDAHAVGRVHREILASAPDELQVYLNVTSGAGDKGVTIILCDSGNSGAGEAAAAQLRSAARPVADTLRRMPYLEIQQTWDDSFPLGYSHYWKSSFLTAIVEDVIDIAHDAIARTELRHCEVDLEPMGGAIGRIAPDATAFADRDAASTFLLATRWSDPAETEARIAWIRETFAAVQPISKPSGYINYMDRGDENRTETNYSANYQRLQELKRRFDPENVFRSNANIRP